MLTVTAPLLLSSLCGNGRAEPLTLYKAENIAIARENVKRHEWAGSILTGYEKRVAYALEQEREFFKAILPDLTPWSTYGQVCPVCVGEKCSPGETGVWQWSITDPDKLRCKYCGAEFPNPDYPETGVLDCPNMGQRFTTTSTLSSAHTRTRNSASMPTAGPGDRCRSASPVSSGR